MVIFGILIFIVSILLIYFSHKQIKRTGNASYYVFMVCSLIPMFIGAYLTVETIRDYLKPTEYDVLNGTAEYVETGKHVIETGDTITTYKIKWIY